RSRGPRNLHLRLPLPGLNSLNNWCTDLPARCCIATKRRLCCNAQTGIPCRRKQESTMYQQFNEQFAAATRQFADTEAQVNRIALENAQAVFGLQMAAMEDRATATFAFLGEATNVRDAEGMKDLLPKGVQVVRENAER